MVALWIKIHWIWIHILYFSPIWFRIPIGSSGCVINLNRIGFTTLFSSIFKKQVVKFYRIWENVHVHILKKLTARTKVTWTLSTLIIGDSVRERGGWVGWGGGAGLSSPLNVNLGVKYNVKLFSLEVPWNEIRLHTRLAKKNVTFSCFVLGAREVVSL